VSQQAPEPPRAPSGEWLTRQLRRAHLHADRVEPLLAEAVRDVLDRAAAGAADRFEALAVDYLTAAAPDPASTMVALYPTQEQAAALALPGGEPAGILHVTLCYLGETVGPLTRVMDALRPVTARHAALNGRVGGVGAFQEGDDGVPLLALPSVPGLVELRVDVAKALTDAGVAYSRDYGYVPHMTMAYLQAPAQVDLAGATFVGAPLTFGSVWVVRGDSERIELPLTGVPPLTAALEPIPGAPGWQADLDNVRRLLDLVKEEKAASQVTDAQEEHEEMLRRIREVAEKHKPDGGYGDVFWHVYDRTVWWECGDWTTSEEIDAAERDFLAIRGVEKFEYGAEETPTAWRLVYSRASSGSLYASAEPFWQSLTAAAEPRPPWVAPAVDELLPADHVINAILARTRPTREAAVEAAMTPVLDSVGIRFDVTNPFIAPLLEATAVHVTEIAETTRSEVRRIVARSYTEGLSIPHTAAAIRAGMEEANVARSKLIARCLSPEAPVDGAVVRAVTRRWYEGHMAVLVTESGREFSATPNHPMLMSRGWRPAGEVDEGDYLICRGVDEYPRPTRHEDVRNPPSAIAEVFEAAAAVGVIDRRRGGQPDFHGDGLDGEVDIAYPDGMLTVGKFAALYQHRGEFVLAPSIMVHGAAFCPRCGRLLPVDQSACFCGSPTADPALTENALHEAARHARCFRDVLDGLALRESGEQALGVDVVSARGGTATAVEVPPARIAERPAFVPGLSKPRQHGTLVHAYGRSGSGGAFAAEVEADRVVSCRLIEFSGHVYNLVTPHGYFTVNGGYTGNTELVGAVNGSSAAAVQVVEQATGVRYTKRWMTAPGAKHPRHYLYDGLNGQQRKMTDAFDVGGSSLQYPGDPNGPAREVCNCFPGSTLVAAPGLRRGYRRLYVGDLMTVETDVGRPVSGTPNHPVLTNAGWKPLREVHEGDYLVRAVPVDGMPWGDPDIHDAPAAIQQVVDSLRRQGVTRRILGGAVQFHGDPSADGEVEVVTADRLLPHGLDAAVGEHPLENMLMRTREPFRAFTVDRSPFQLNVGRPALATGGVSRSSESAAPVAVGLTHPLPHRRRPSTRLDTGEEQVPADHVAGDAVALGQRLLGNAFEVTVAKVVRVQVDAFHGEVFNLETATGAYTAAEYISHNCRCAMDYREGAPAPEF
jgi:2'-5' RNA ligase